MRASYNFDSLTTFLVGYYDSMRVLRTAEDFHDLAMAYLARAASQNVRHVEMFFDPQAHTGRGVPFGTVVEGLRRAVLEAHRTHGVHAELIMCFLRDLSAEYAMATLVQALPYKDWILGVGLDSDERGHPPEKFAAVFTRARAEGFALTMHCDIDQPGSIDNIRTVLETIGVDRIDHGTNNLVALAEKAALSRDELAQLSRNAFEIAWLPSATRDRYLTEIDEYMASFRTGD